MSQVQPGRSAMPWVLLALTSTILDPGTSMGAEGNSQLQTPITPMIAFPEGTATASEVCGACHKAMFQEMSKGTGADLDWKDMQVQARSTARVRLPSDVSRSTTAHFVAGTDPWPLEAVQVEEGGRKCTVCHYPAPLEYPAMDSVRIDPPKPRDLHQERGVTCASCHLTPEGKIRGPYVVSAPHESVADERIRTSVACAYCHSSGARVVGKQTQTFLEWREDFNKPGLGAQQCQDCHMPRTVRKLAEDFDVPERVVARHLLTGGHSYQRISGALDLAVTAADAGRSALTFRVTNIGAGHSVPTGSNRRAIYLSVQVVDSKSRVVATREWMFAPSFGNRPDDRALLEEDKKGPNPIASMQADRQGPHESPVRAGETRVLEWTPAIAAGTYTVRAALTYDLNRYNDRAFKEDQHQIARWVQSVQLSGTSRPPSASGRH